MEAFHKALEIVADRAVQSTELDQSAMHDLAIEFESGHHFLGHPLAEDHDGFIFGVLGLKTLATAENDSERAAAARLLRAAVACIERYEFCQPSGRFVILHSGHEIRIVIVKYVSDRPARSSLVGSFQLSA
jgi:hypothetical protein